MEMGSSKRVGSEDWRFMGILGLTKGPYMNGQSGRGVLWYWSSGLLMCTHTYTDMWGMCKSTLWRKSGMEGKGATSSCTFLKNPDLPTQYSNKDGSWDSGKELRPGWWPLPSFSWKSSWVTMLHPHPSTLLLLSYLIRPWTSLRHGDSVMKYDWPSI